MRDHRTGGVGSPALLEPDPGCRPQATSFALREPRRIPGPMSSRIPQVRSPDPDAQLFVRPFRGNPAEDMQAREHHGTGLRLKRAPRNGQRVRRRTGPLDGDGTARALAVFAHTKSPGVVGLPEAVEPFDARDQVLPGENSEFQRCSRRNWGGSGWTQRGWGGTASSASAAAAERSTVNTPEGKEKSNSGNLGTVGCAVWHSGCQVLCRHPLEPSSVGKCRGHKNKIPRIPLASRYLDLDQPTSLTIRIGERVNRRLRRGWDS